MAVRRRQMGMSRDELARRAGMSTTYLREVESRAGDFDPGALARLAVVLEMPYEELTTGRTDAPPGRGGPAQHPVLVRLWHDTLPVRCPGRSRSAPRSSSAAPRGPRSRG
ncbi:helix-turn-helix domain-containing protein [Streptomyces olivaceus]|nr:helix-turn-helix transcriptional regulator [Streptomyces olivaceus]